jgi:zinc ribbon protein
VATDAKQPGGQVPNAGPAASRVSAFPDPSPGSEEPTADRPPDLALLHRKAQTALARALGPGEEPRLVIVGLLSSALVATDTRLFVFKTGARAGLPFGARLKEFEYESVMRVDLRPADEADVIVIHAPLKISTCSSYWADKRDDPWKARNAVAVTRGSTEAKRAVERLSLLVLEFRDRGAAARAGQAQKPAPAIAKKTPDVVERIAGREQTTGRPEILPVPREQDDQAGDPATEDCPRCGSELSAGWHFCPRCGAPAKFTRSGRATPRRRRS